MLVPEDSAIRSDKAGTEACFPDCRVHMFQLVHPGPHGAILGYTHPGVTWASLTTDV